MTRVLVDVNLGDPGFRNPYVARTSFAMDEDKYAGMTVNERLFAADLLDAYEAAAMNRDRTTMIAILARVEMTPEQSVQTTDEILADPKKYGF